MHTMAAATTLANISVLLLGEDHSRSSHTGKSKRMPARIGQDPVEFLKKKSESRRLS
jgi:hypothetical protein